MRSVGKDQLPTISSKKDVIFSVGIYKCILDCVCECSCVGVCMAVRLYVTKYCVWYVRVRECVCV